MASRATAQPVAAAPAATASSSRARSGRASAQQPSIGAVQPGRDRWSRWSPAADPGRRSREPARRGRPHNYVRPWPGVHGSDALGRACRLSAEQAAGRPVVADVVRDQHHRPPGHQRVDRDLQISRAVTGSRCAVGSSSSTSGASRRNARASAMRWRCPADSRRPRSPSWVSKPSRQRLDERLGAGQPRGPADASAAGSPAGRARCSRRWCRRTGTGCCGTQAICAASATGIVARSMPPTVMLPAVGSAKPQQQREQRALARSARARDQRTCSPGLIVRPTSVRAASGRPG